MTTALRRPLYLDLTITLDVPADLPDDPYLAEKIDAAVQTAVIRLAARIGRAGDAVYVSDSHKVRFGDAHDPALEPF